MKLFTKKQKRAAELLPPQAELDAGADRHDLLESKGLFKLIWRKKLEILGSTAVFLIFLSCVFFYQSSATNTVVLSLNYEESSKGLNPNSTRFNMYEIKSDDVLTRAIEYAGLSGMLSPSELSENLSVTPLNTKTVQDGEDYYISSSYSIKYTRNRELGALRTDQMVSQICKAYNDIFHELYADKKSSLQYDQPDFSTMEYVQIGDVLTDQAERIDRYLSQRVGENGGYVSSETGESFQTIQRLIQNLQEYDIDKYNSYVLQSGLAKDKTALSQTLAFKNSELDMTYQKSMAEYAVRANTIKMYDEAMIGTVMIPSVNENMEYYMSRTNIGIDYLAKEADSHLAQAKDTLKEIEENNNVIAMMNQNSPAPENFPKAEEMLREIDSEFQRISSLAAATDRSYIKYKTKDYLGFKTAPQTFSQRIQLKKVLVLGAGFFVLLCAALYFIHWRNRGRGSAQ